VKRRRVVVVQAVRTPWCRRGGALSAVAAAELGAIALREVVLRAGLRPEAVEGVVVGSARSSGALAAEVALRADMATPASSAAMGAASGERAIAEAVAAIRLGPAAVTVAVGVETPSEIVVGMSQPLREAVANTVLAERAIDKMRGWAGLKAMDLRPASASARDPVTGESVEVAAEGLAQRLGLDRDAQDRYAIRSHSRAVEAQKAGHGSDRVIVVPTPPDATLVERDDGPRPGLTLHALAEEPPLCAADDEARVPASVGTVTASNVAEPADGAAALLLADADMAAREGWSVMGEIVDVRFAVDDPFERPFLAGATALLELLDARRLDPAELAAVEMVEPAAALVLGAVDRLAGLDVQRVNRWGGNIAFGRPAGANGPRLVMTALDRLEDEGGQLAAVASGAEAGQGAALLLKR
jgi:acetyl-CoA acyltransferase